MKKSEWKRNCPECGNKLFYSTKANRVRAEKQNTNCMSCALTGRLFADKHKKNISESKKGKPGVNLGKKFNDTWRKNLGESKKGHTPWNKNKKGLQIAWNKGKKYSKEIRKKMSESHKGKKVTEETQKNMRLSALKRIKRQKGQVSPNYSPVSCEIIRWFNMYYDFNFQHAENGGEVCIGGYFPDGIDEKKKTIIEIDEKHHFNSDGTYKEKDIRRQNYLEGLGYKFIRIRI